MTEEKTIVKVLFRERNGVVQWTNPLSPGYPLAATVLAYGWSDGSVTWKP